MSNIQLVDNEKPNLILDIIVTGSKKSGKTQFIQCFTQSDVKKIDEQHQFIKQFKDNIIEFQILEQQWNQRNQYQYKKDVIILIFNLSDESFFSSCESEIMWVKNNISPHTTLLVIGNKSDIAAKDISNNLQQVTNRLCTQYMEASALTGYNCQEALLYIVEQQSQVSNLMRTASIGQQHYYMHNLKPIQLKLQLKRGLKNGYTALMYAAEGNNLDCAKELLEEAGMQDEKGNTALLIAISHMSKEIIELLAPLEKGIKNAKGESPYKMAIQNNLYEFHEILFNENETDEIDDGLQLMIAAATGNVELVRELKNKQINQQQKLENRHEYTALMYAVEENHFDCAKELLNEAGLKNKDGDTALIIAIRNKNKDMMQLLAPLENGIKNNDGQSPFKIAIQNNITDFLNILYNDDENYENDELSPLMVAASSGDIELVRRLKNTQLKLKGKRSYEKDYTSLMYAVDKNHIECAKELLDEAGMKNQKEDTALLMALKQYITKNEWNEWNENTQIIELLAPLEKGIVNIDGETPFQIALKEKQFEFLEMLYDENENYDSDVITPLMIATSLGSKQWVSILKEKFVKIQGNNEYKRGYTALMYAAEGNNLDCAKELLEEAGMQDEKGNTALLIAISHMSKEIIELLAPLEKGIKNAKGESPYKMAIQYNLYEFHEILFNENETDEIDDGLQLMIAVTAGNVELVRELKNKQINQQQKLENRNGYTALMYAVEENHFDCAKELLDEAGLKNIYGDTALLIALKQYQIIIKNEEWNDGIIQIIELLAPIEKSIKSINGETPFQIAIQKKLYASQNVLYDEHEQNEYDEKTQLMIAATVGNVEWVKKLKQKQVSKQQQIQDNKRYSALMYAVEENHIDCARELLHETGLKNKDGDTALLIAFKQYQLLKKQFEKHEYDEYQDKYEDYYAEFLEKSDQIKELIKLVAPLENGIKNNDGQSPFKIAIQNNITDFLNILYNDDENYENDELSPLMVAASSGDIELVRRLKNKQMKLKGQKEYQWGYTALMYAVDNNHIDCAKELLGEAGMQNEEGDTALLIAIKLYQSLDQNQEYDRNIEIIEMLAPLEKGIKNISGDTALIYAIENKQMEIIELLAPLEKEIAKKTYQLDVETEKYPIELFCEQCYKKEIINSIIISKFAINKTAKTALLKLNNILNQMQFSNPHNGQVLKVIGCYQGGCTKSSLVTQREESIDVQIAMLKVTNGQKNYCCKLSIFYAEKLTRSFKEVNIYQRLNNTNVIKQDASFYLFDEDMYCYVFLIMEEGIPIQDYFENNMLIGECKKLLSDICDGIMYLHSYNIIHRDIKPDNVLIVRDEAAQMKWAAKIIDFDASIYTEKDAMLEDCVGTVDFIAPEVQIGSYNSKCDLFSFGKTIQFVVEQLQNENDKLKFQPLIVNLTQENQDSRMSLVAVKELLQRIK